MDQLSRIILIFAFILIVLGLLFVFESQKVGKLRLVFCDIGQGDGALIITPKGKQTVVDGGPGTKIIDCLGGKMPFWDRTIEMIVMTHAQKDHMEGQIEIFKRYKVERVIWTGIGNDSEVFKEWESQLSKENAEVIIAKSVTDIDIENVLIDILWPSQNMLSEWQSLPPDDLNDSSVVFRLEYGDFCAYFTGDLDKEFLQSLLDSQCEVLKISHHGSKTGTNQEIIDKVNPEIAVIQVGENSFGHPTQEVLELLEGTKVLRNDKNGIIEIETDGGRFSTRAGQNSN